MNGVPKRDQRFFSDERGQASTEYGLIIVLVAILLLAVISSLSEVLQGYFTNLATAIRSAMPP